nr:cystathionine beta-lyase [Sandaracinobacteroides saxicola]
MSEADTWLVEAGRRRAWTHGIVNPPLYRASTVLYETIAAMDAANRDVDANLYYGRKGTPTTWALREALTGLEPGAEGTMLMPSGVSAITAAILSCAKAGDHVLLPDSAYDPTSAFADGLMRRFGIEPQWYDPLIGAGVAGLFRANTAALLLESPGSLTFEVQDVPAMAAVAREAGVVTILDNTWATSLYFQGIRHGCDLVMQACTKYVVGHSDSMLGSVTANAARWRDLQKTVWQLGLCVGADDAALGLRGLRTMGVRLARHQESGLKVARWLAAHPLVDRVLHPALESCPGHALWRRDFSGASGLFGVVLKAGSRADAAHLCDGMRHFGLGFSWGGYESLMIPCSPERLRRVTRWQAPGLCLRLHVGLEDVGDLIADLEAGLARFAAAVGGS